MRSFPFFPTARTLLRIADRRFRIEPAAIFAYEPIVGFAICGLRWMMLFAVLHVILPELTAQTRPTPVKGGLVVYGYVYLPDGSPAARAIVRLRTTGGFTDQVLSDDRGLYEIPGVTLRGECVLTAQNPAAPEQFMDPVELSDPYVSPDGRVKVDLFLRLKPVAGIPRNGSEVLTLGEMTQKAPKPAQKAFDQAVKYRAEKQFDKALKSLDRAIELYPSYFQAFAERGQLKLSMDQVTEAAEDIAKALDLNPRYGPALLGAGMCLFQQGNYTEAIRYLNGAAEVEPRNATNYFFLGLANLALDRRDTARAAFQKALNLDPKAAARAHVHLANLFIKEGRPADAIAELDAYLMVVPRAPDANKLRALASQLRSQAIR